MRSCFLAVALAAVFSTGCNKKSSAAATGECATSDDCASGLQCIDAVCVSVDCTSSVDCPFETYCDVTAYTCLDGCKEDTDCMSGSTCDTVANACVASECTDTQIDCAYGENCNTSTGQCVGDDRGHCDPCDALNGGGNQCPGGQCFFWGGSSCNNSSDCDDGYQCDNVPGYGKICHADYCLISCQPNATDACPRGFECQDATGLGEYYCSADCNYMVTNGYL